MLEAWTQQLLAPRYGWWLLQGWLVTLALSAVAIAASTVLGVGLAGLLGARSALNQPPWRALREL